MGLFEITCRPTTDPPYRVLTLSLPPPPPQRKKSTTHPKMSPHQTCPSPVRCPRDRSHRQPPIRESSASDPWKGFPPKTRKRPRVDSIKTSLSSLLVTAREQQPWCAPTRMWLTSSENPSKNHQEPDSSKQVRVRIPPPNTTQSSARAVSQDYHSLTPVRGPTSTPIPPPFHRFGETCSQTSLPRAIVCFLFSRRQIDGNSNPPCRGFD
jgi:hypothetical protein